MTAPRRSMAQGVLMTPDVRVVLTMHTTRGPSPEDWDAYCELLRRHSEAVQWDLTRVTNLVITDGWAPSTVQRTRLNSIIAQGRSAPRVAVATDSAAVRMVARAFSVFNPMFRVFSPQQLAAASSFVGVTRSSQRDLLAALDQMEEEQLGRGAVKTLEVLRQAAR